MGKKTASVDKVISFIKTGIDQKRWADGVRLPATVTLARLLKINTVTLGAALKILAVEQLITIIAGKGVFVGTAVLQPPPVVDAASTLRDCAWRRLQQQLEHDLFSNIFSSGELPQKSTLSERYGVCYQTISKVCDVLVRKGVLSRFKNRYRIVAQVRSSSSTSVLLISHSTTETISLYNHFIQNGIAALELLCSRNNLTLVKKGSSSANGGKLILEHVSQSTYFGYIIWVVGVEQTFLLHLLSLLAQTGKPVAIIDEEANFVIPPMFGKTRHFKVFVHENFRAGRMMGIHLLNRGHRKCAFISSNQSAQWSIARHEGVAQTFHDAGCKDGVVPILCQPETYPLTSRHFYLQKFNKGIADRFSHIDWWYGPLIDSALQTGIGGIDYLYRTTLSGNLFRQALRNPDITAWVCANDLIAIAALHYFKRMEAENAQPSVPLRRIAVVGFDDIALSTEHNLTTYNFMSSVVIENAIGFIIRPHQEFFLDKKIIECEGLLIARASTATNTTQ